MANRLKLALCAVVAFAATLSAHATPVPATYYFELTDSVDYFDFQIDSSTIPQTSVNGVPVDAAWQVDLNLDGNIIPGLPIALVPDSDGALYFVGFGAVFFTTPGDYATFYTGGGTASTFTLGTYYVTPGATLLTLTAAETPFAHIAATPEPSSLMLLGTGLLGTISFARRKFNR